MKDRFTMQFRNPAHENSKWTWFDTDSREYTLVKAIERVRGCYFKGIHEVRITCQSPHQHVYQGMPTTNELTLWLAHFGNNEELDHDEQEGL